MSLKENIYNDYLQYYLHIISLSKECRAYRNIFVEFCKFVNYKH